MLVTLIAVPTSQGQTINFDSLANGTTGTALSNYMSSCGITLNGVTPGVFLLATDNASSSDGIRASSNPNCLRWGGRNDTWQTFTLNFMQPLTHLSFTRCAEYPVNGGTAFPAWNATVYQGSTVVGSAGENAYSIWDPNSSPAQTYNFDGIGITAITFSANTWNFAGFGSPGIDDIVMTPAGFADSFEAASLDPFWSKVETSGSVVFPATTRVHGGSQCVELNTTSSGANKDVEIFHQFPSQTNGTVSVWFYDTGADVSSGNYIQFGVSSNGVTVANLLTYDYDLGPGDGGSTYLYYTPPVNRYTGNDRTQAWHQFTICAWSNSMTLLIDGNAVYSGPGSSFDRVIIAVTGPSWRPALGVQFDDFSFVSHPAVATLGIRMYAGVNVAGSVGAPYQLQYKNSLSGASWQPLADIILPASPYFFVDTNTPYSSQRFYRAVAKP